jgi:hypothetical protein
MRVRDESGLTRRELLGAGVALAAAAAIPTGALAAPLLPTFAGGATKTKRVVLVVFGGGVRSRETVQSGNVPNLMRIAGEGVLFPSTHVENVGHYGAAVSILTGVTENFGIRENDRTPHATVFEMVRKGANLPASDCWLSTSGSDQETNYAYGTDSRYGARYGANLIGGEGLFNAEFKELLGGDKALGAANPKQDELVRRLRGALHPPLPAEGSGGVGNDPETAARIESYVLEELRGGTSAITGLGANDAKAMRVARNLMGIFRPRLLAVTLRNADVAHGSFNDYVQVIRRNDDELGKLADAIRNDKDLRDSTALFVLPEFGRDRDLNLRRGLDHGDDSDELHKVALVAWGPDFKKGKVSSSEVRSLDVAPTIASMFGVSPGSARGSMLPDLFA